MDVLDGRARKAAVFVGREEIGIEKKSQSIRLIWLECSILLSNPFDIIIIHLVVFALGIALFL
jgi:hypothetical protein